jgi:hypothetical protein
MLFRARAAAKHVLDGGDAVAQAVDGAKERAQPDLARRELARRRQDRQGNPHFERYVFEHAARQHVVGVIVRVDQAGNDQFVPAIHHHPVLLEFFATRRNSGDFSFPDDNIFGLRSSVWIGQNRSAHYDKIASRNH